METKSAPASIAPATPTHLYDLVAARARQFPDQVALGGQDGLRWTTIDGGAFVRLVDALAAELADAGIAVGDRVILWVPDHWWTPIYLFALWKLGAVAVPFDRDTNARAAERIIAATEPRAILTGYAEAPGWLSGDERALQWWEPGTRREPSETEPWSAPSEEVAAIFFTSGTTGAPKGCVITHANLLHQVRALGTKIPLGPDCRLASILPLSHLFSLSCGLLYPLSRGAAIHFVPSRRGPEIVRVLREQRITHMIGVPQLLEGMTRALDERLRGTLPPAVVRAAYALAERLPFRARRVLFWPIHRQIGGALVTLASGGAALAPEVQRAWERLGVRVACGYGTSECSPVVSAGRADGSTPIGSVGTPLPEVEVKLGPDGELFVRGPNVFRGYWRDPERTAEVLRDGWYATGDLARIDARGNVWIQGRARELIVLPSGQNVWPSDVEDALRAQPAVRDAVVLPVPGPNGGVALHAYLLPMGVAGDVAPVLAGANRLLATHQRVATASWWPEEDFPRTNTLKVRRHLLPVPDPAARAAPFAPPADADAIRAAVASLAHRPSVRDEDTLGALGFDSLGLVELTLLLEEKTGQAIPDDALTPELTVAEVRERVGAPAAEDAGRGEVGPFPDWPYTWGRFFRFLRFPLDLLYRWARIETIVLGAEHLAGLPPEVILAGTHRSYVDLFLLRDALEETPSRGLARRLLIAASATRLAQAGPLAWYGALGFGLYPLEQHRQQLSSLRALAGLARRGYPLLIFPQGRYVTTAQEQAGDPAARFRPGVGYLAEALGAVVVPFGVAGTPHILPPSPPPNYRGPVIAGIPVLLRRGRLAIAFGEPLRRRPDENAAAFTARLEQTSHQLTARAEATLANRSP